MERWLPVVGHERYYEVSDLGRVKSLRTGRVMRPNMSGRYRRVEIYSGEGSRWLSIHRLVMEAFIGPNELDVNHIDGDRDNNALENLEYCTKSQNMKHAFRIGLQSNHGERHSQRKLSNAAVLEIRSLAEAGMKQSELGARYGVDPSAISRVLSGARWGHLDNVGNNGANNAVVAG